MTLAEAKQSELSRTEGRDDLASTTPSTSASSGAQNSQAISPDLPPAAASTSQYVKVEASAQLATDSPGVAALGGQEGSRRRLTSAAFAPPVKGFFLERPTDISRPVPSTLAVDEGETGGPASPRSPSVLEAGSDGRLEGAAEGPAACRPPAASAPALPPLPLAPPAVAAVLAAACPEAAFPRAVPEGEAQRRAAGDAAAVSTAKAAAAAAARSAGMRLPAGGAEGDLHEAAVCEGLCLTQLLSETALPPELLQLQMQTFFVDTLTYLRDTAAVLSASSTADVSEPEQQPVSPAAVVEAEANFAHHLQVILDCGPLNHADKPRCSQNPSAEEENSQNPAKAAQAPATAVTQPVHTAQRSTPTATTSPHASPHPSETEATSAALPTLLEGFPASTSSLSPVKPEVSEGCSEEAPPVKASWPSTGRSATDALRCLSVRELPAALCLYVPVFGPLLLRSSFASAAEAAQLAAEATRRLSVLRRQQLQREEGRRVEQLLELQREHNQGLRLQREELVYRQRKRRLCLACREEEENRQGKVAFAALHASSSFGTRPLQDTRRCAHKFAAAAEEDPSAGGACLRSAPCGGEGAGAAWPHSGSTPSGPSGDACSIATSSHATALFAGGPEAKPPPLAGGAACASCASGVLASEGDFCVLAGDVFAESEDEYLQHHHHQHRRSHCPAAAAAKHRGGWRSAAAAAASGTALTTGGFAEMGGGADCTHGGGGERGAVERPFDERSAASESAGASNATGASSHFGVGRRYERRARCGEQLRLLRLAQDEGDDGEEGWSEGSAEAASSSDASLPTAGGGGGRRGALARHSAAAGAGGASSRSGAAAPAAGPGLASRGAAALAAGGVAGFAGAAASSSPARRGRVHGAAAANAASAGPAGSAATLFGSAGPVVGLPSSSRDGQSQNCRDLAEKFLQGIGVGAPAGSSSTCTSAAVAAPCYGAGLRFKRGPSTRPGRGGGGSAAVFSDEREGSTIFAPRKKLAGGLGAAPLHSAGDLATSGGCAGVMASGSAGGGACGKEALRAARRLGISGGDTLEDEAGGDGLCGGRAVSGDIGDAASLGGGMDALAAGAVGAVAGVGCTSVGGGGARSAALPGAGGVREGTCFEEPHDEMRPMKGVYFDKTQKSWIGSFYEERRQIKKRFKVATYGYHTAKALAINVRLGFERKVRLRDDDCRDHSSASHAEKLLAGATEAALAAGEAGIDRQKAAQLRLLLQSAERGATAQLPRSELLQQIFKKQPKSYEERRHQQQAQQQQPHQRLAHAAAGVSSAVPHSQTSVVGGLPLHGANRTPQAPRPAPVAAMAVDGASANEPWRLSDPSAKQRRDAPAAAPPLQTSQAPPVVSPPGAAAAEAQQPKLPPQSALALPSVPQAVPSGTGRGSPTAGQTSPQVEGAAEGMTLPLDLPPELVAAVSEFEEKLKLAFGASARNGAQRRSSSLGASPALDENCGGAALAAPAAAAAAPGQISTAPSAGLAVRPREDGLPEGGVVGSALAAAAGPGERNWRRRAEGAAAPASGEQLGGEKAEAVQGEDGVAEAELDAAFNEALRESRDPKSIFVQSLDLAVDALERFAPLAPDAPQAVEGGPLSAATAQTATPASAVQTQRSAAADGAGGSDASSQLSNALGGGAATPASSEAPRANAAPTSTFPKGAAGAAQGQWSEAEGHMGGTEARGEGVPDSAQQNASAINAAQPPGLEADAGEDSDAALRDLRAAPAAFVKAEALAAASSGSVQWRQDSGGEEGEPDSAPVSDIEGAAAAGVNGRDPLPLGVFYTQKKQAYCANWYEGRRQLKRYFPVQKLGEEEARRRAISARKEAEDREAHRVTNHSAALPPLRTSLTAPQQTIDYLHFKQPHSHKQHLLLPSCQPQQANEQGASCTPRRLVLDGEPFTGVQAAAFTASSTATVGSSNASTSAIGVPAVGSGGVVIDVPSGIEAGEVVQTAAAAAKISPGAHFVGMACANGAGAGIGASAEERCLNNWSGSERISHLSSDMDGGRGEGVQ